MTLPRCLALVRQRKLEAEAVATRSESVVAARIVPSRVRLTAYSSLPVDLDSRSLEAEAPSSSPSDRAAHSLAPSRLPKQCRPEYKNSASLPRMSGYKLGSVSS